MALDKLTKVQSVGISSFIQVVGVVTATGGFDGDLIGNITGAATGDFLIDDRIVHTGDTNTAIRFPSADTFTVETGGSERFKVTDSLKEVKNGNLRITSTYIDFSGDISTPTTAAAIFRPADNTLAFSTANAERLRITSSGVTVTGSATVTEGLVLDGQTGSGKGLRLDLAGSSDYVIQETTTDDVVQFGGTGSSNFFTHNISSGKIGINTASPRAVLDVEGNAENATLMLHSNDANANLQFSDNTGGARILNYGGDLAFRTGTNAHAFGTGDSEALRIKSNGNIGVGGITGPAFTTGGGIHLARNYGIGFGDGASGRPDFQLVTTNGGSLDFRCGFGADTADISMTTGGNLVFASGGGIDFSANSNASGVTSEVLDDYEEGNFTPIVRGRTTAGTATYGRTAVGKYTKVGRMVDVMVDMVFSGANGNGNIEIAGLPFAAHSGPYVRFAGDVTLLTAGISWSNQIACYINDTNSHFWITNTPTSGNYAFVNINSNTTEILLHCTYMVS